MRWADLSFSDRAVRQFSVLGFVILAALALWEGYRHSDIVVPSLLAGLGFLLGIIGFFRPGWIRPVYVLWMIVVFPIGWIISHLLLGILFYGLFTPIGMIFRVMNRDVLNRRFEPDRDTYWEPRKSPGSMDRYFRQY